MQGDPSGKQEVDSMQLVLGAFLLGHAIVHIGFGWSPAGSTR
jgi:hypothetical protein